MAQTFSLYSHSDGDCESPKSNTDGSLQKKNWLTDKGKVLGQLYPQKAGKDDAMDVVLLWEHEVGSLIHILAQTSLYPNTDSVRTTVKHDYSSNVNNKLSSVRCRFSDSSRVGSQASAIRLTENVLTSLIADPIVKAARLLTFEAINQTSQPPSQRSPNDGPLEGIVPILKQVQSPC